jgi:uncharacterized protein
MKRYGKSGLVFLWSVFLVSCAGQPVQLYTLDTPSVRIPDRTLTSRKKLVLEVRRVTLPDYEDNQDIIRRDGLVVKQSANGRWSERLSVGVTDALVAKIGAMRSELFVTADTSHLSSFGSLTVTVTRLDIAGDGQAVLQADYAFVPSDPGRPPMVRRVTASSLATDRSDFQTVSAINNLIGELAARISKDI